MPRPPALALVAASPVLAAALLLGAACSKPQAVAPRPAPFGPELIGRPDLLPVLRDGAVMGMVSSYDRTGGNDDGFSGRYSFLRREGDGLVIADLEGPGLITRFHTPTPTGDPIEFWFDGEERPRLRLPLREMFEGGRAPFLEPLVGGGSGGRWSYVPLPFRRSCKVVIRAASFQFYDLDFVRFPAATEVETWQDPPSAAWLREVESARRLLARSGRDVSDALVPEGVARESRAVARTLRPGTAATLFELSRPGRIVGLRLAPAAALSGKGREIVLRVTWDGADRPAIEAPVVDLFGGSFGEPAARSLFAGTTADGTDYLYLPMPFERSARVELADERAAGEPIEVRAETVFARLGKAPNEGRLYARWRRENPTVEGRPYTYLRAEGRGHVVGVMLQAQGLEPGGTAFFEGDDRAVLDGALAVPGTGSEDSYNGGWYDVPGRWDARASYPLSGCLDYRKPLGRTGGYRWLLGDAYSFARSVDFTIEHGPERNAVPADYASTTFFYAAEPPAPEPLPPAAARRVSDPDRVVFVPGWNVPLRTTSLERFTLSKRVERVAGEDVRVLRLTTTGEDVFGPHHLGFVCDLPAAGTWRVGIKAVLGPEQGIVQVLRGDRPAGTPVDLYAASPAVGGVATLGEFELEAGPNVLALALVGKNARARGAGLALAQIVFERTGR